MKLPSVFLPSGALQYQVSVVAKVLFAQDAVLTYISRRTTLDKKVLAVRTCDHQLWSR